MQLACNQFCRPHFDQLPSTADITVRPYSMCTYVHVHIQYISSTLVRQFIFTAFFAQLFLTTTTSILLQMYPFILYCNWWHFLVTTTTAKTYLITWNCAAFLLKSAAVVWIQLYIIGQDEKDVRQLALIDRFPCIIRDFSEWMDCHGEQSWEWGERACRAVMDGGGYLISVLQMASVNAREKNWLQLSSMNGGNGRRNVGNSIEAWWSWEETGSWEWNATKR